MRATPRRIGLLMLVGLLASAGSSSDWRRNAVGISGFLPDRHKS